MFKIWVFRKIFGSKRYEVTGYWRKLCNDKLGDMYSSPDTICVINEMKEDEMGGSCGTDGEEWCRQAFEREGLRKETNWKTRVHMGR